MLGFLLQHPICLIILYLVIGFFGSMIVVLIGGGISLITLPFLSMIFYYIFPANIALKMAISTTIAVMAVLALMSLITFIRMGFHPDYRYFVILLPFMLIGSIVGPHITVMLSVTLLHLVIGMLLILLSVYNFFLISFKTQINEINDFPAMTCFLMVKNSLAMLVSSILSSTSGTAVGIWLIPRLTKCLPHRKAISTSMFLGLLNALVGSTVYTLHGQHLPIKSNWHLGYIYLPPVIAIAIAAVPGIRIGKKLIKMFSTVWVKRIFYVYVLISGIVIIVSP
ncbi:MAG: sulfite exporter TauE/SafE family protein [Pseudomonadota bacterium]